MPRKTGDRRWRTCALAGLTAALLAGCGAPDPGEPTGASREAEPTLPYARIGQYDIPSTLECGEIRDVHVEMFNTGSITWDPATYSLGAVGDEDPLGGPGRVPLSGPVYGGSSNPFTFALHAGYDEVTATTRWQMVDDEQYGWFGEELGVSVHVNCPTTDDDDAELSADFFPTGIPCNERRFVYVHVHNTGTTSWSTTLDGRHGYVLRLTPGSDLLTERSEFPFPEGVVIPTSGEYDFGFYVYALNYTADSPIGFELYNLDRGHAFGNALHYNLHTSCVADDSILLQNGMAPDVACGDPYPVHVEFENAGSTTWSREGGYYLAYSGSAPQPFPGFVRRDFPANSGVPPQGVATFDFLLTAPNVPHPAYVEAWRLKHGDQYFGATASQAVNVHCAPDTLELGAVTLARPLACGSSYPVSITVKNRGSATWDSHYVLLGVNPVGPEYLRIPSNVHVPPGGNYTFTFDIAAPYTAGPLHLEYVMSHDNVGHFGPNIHVDSTFACPQFDARVLSVSGPSADVVQCTDTVPFRISVKNTGTATWGASGRPGEFPIRYALAQTQAVGLVSDPIVQALSPTPLVRPGQTTTFELLVRRMAPEPSPHLASSVAWRMTETETNQKGISTTRPFGETANASLAGCP